MTELETTIFSECRRYKAEIERRSNDVLQVTAYQWYEEWVDGYDKVVGFWARADRSSTYTDTLERAVTLAREKLQSLGCQIPT